MSAIRGLLLLGTDTGVGKTAVAQGLLRLAHRRGLRLIPLKPAETGCDPEPRDAHRLMQAARVQGLQLADVCPYQFSPPVAPSVAARLAGTQILPGVIRDAAARLRGLGDALLVESAGGVRTPYAPDITSASWANLLDIDILLVSANRLGTINHTALALEVLARMPARLIGLVMVQVAASETPDRAHNSAEIERLTGVRPLGVLRHCPDPDPDTLADALARDIALAPLWGGALQAAGAPIDRRS